MQIEATDPSQDVMSGRSSIQERRFRTSAKGQRSSWLVDFKQEALLDYIKQEALLNYPKQKGFADYVLPPGMASAGFGKPYFMQWPQLGVDTESLRPLSEHSDESDWTDAKNDRRCELIDKEIEGTLLPAEKRELEELQSQMLAYRRKVAPLPLKEAQRLHQHLLNEVVPKSWTRD